MQLKLSIAVLAAASWVCKHLVSRRPTASAAAFVEHGRGVDQCGADPGDAPGLPGFDLANTTVVVSANGGLHVTCYGSLPSGLTLPQTFQGDVIRRGEEAWSDVTGHIVATRSGQVMLTSVSRHPPRKTTLAPKQDGRSPAFGTTGGAAEQPRRVGGPRVVAAIGACDDWPTGRAIVDRRARGRGLSPAIGGFRVVGARSSSPSDRALTAPVRKRAKMA